MDIRKGDIVQVDNRWYGRVIDIATTQDNEVIAYRVEALEPITAPTLTPNPNDMWVDYDNVVSYTALRAAFGPIPSVEKAL